MLESKASNLPFLQHPVRKILELQSHLCAEQIAVEQSGY